MKKRKRQEKHQPGSSRAQRAVSFSDAVSVLAFERQLMGGGGVPEDDSISLGLGDRLVSICTQPLNSSPRTPGQVYCRYGAKTTEERTELLCEWQPAASLQSLLHKQVGPELEELKRLRDQSVQCPLNQRYMPTTQSQAVDLAIEDAASAKDWAGESAQRKGKCSIQ